MSSTYQQHPAIRSRLYLAGRFISRDPLPVQITARRFESRVPTSSLGLRVDRAFTYDGAPNIRTKHEFTLPWSNIQEPALLEHLDRLAATGQPFAFGLWKQAYDVWDGDGAGQSFYLQRRQLLEAATPATVFPDYPTRLTLFDGPCLDPASTPAELTVTQKTTADIDTGDPSAGEAWVSSDGEMWGNVWRARVRVGDVPPDEHDCLVAAYLPLYTVVVGEDQQRSYAQSLMEPRTLKLVEFG